MSKDAAPGSVGHQGTHTKVGTYGYQLLYTTKNGPSAISNYGAYPSLERR